MASSSFDTMGSSTSSSKGMVSTGTGKKKKKQTADQEDDVFELKLFDPSKLRYPEFDYPELMRQKTGTDEGLEDPFEDNEEHQKLKEIAKRFEAKYGNCARDPKGKKIKFGNPEDYLDLGIGYDKSDSFIDDSEAYDELVPSTLTTQHGGFYLNCGTLQFKEVPSSDDEDSSEQSSVDSDSEKRAKKRKSLVIKSESDDDEEPPKKHKKVESGLQKKLAKSGNTFAASPLTQKKTKTQQSNDIAAKIKKKNFKSVNRGGIPNLARVESPFDQKKNFAEPKKPKAFASAVNEAKKTEKKDSAQYNANLSQEKKPLDPQRMSRISDIVKSVISATSRKSEDTVTVTTPSTSLTKTTKAEESAPSLDIGDTGPHDLEDIGDLLKYVEDDSVAVDKIALPEDIAAEAQTAVAELSASMHDEGPASQFIETSSPKNSASSTTLELALANATNASAESSSSTSSMNNTSSQVNEPAQRMVGHPPTATIAPKTKVVEKLPENLSQDLRNMIAKFEQQLIRDPQSGRLRLNKNSDAILVQIDVETRRDQMNQNQRSQVWAYLGFKAERNKQTLKQRIQNVQLKSSSQESCSSQKGSSAEELVVEALRKQMEQQKRQKPKEEEARAISGTDFQPKIGKSFEVCRKEGAAQQKFPDLLDKFVIRLENHNREHPIPIGQKFRMTSELKLFFKILVQCLVMEHKNLGVVNKISLEEYLKRSLERNLIRHFPKTVTIGHLLRQSYDVHSIPSYCPSPIRKTDTITVSSKAKNLSFPVEKRSSSSTSVSSSSSTAPYNLTSSSLMKKPFTGRSTDDLVAQIINESIGQNKSPTRSLVGNHLKVDKSNPQRAKMSATSSSASSSGNRPPSVNTGTTQMPAQKSKSDLNQGTNVSANPYSSAGPKANFNSDHSGVRNGPVELPKSRLNYGINSLISNNLAATNIGVRSSGGSGASTSSVGKPGISEATTVGVSQKLSHFTTPNRNISSVGAGISVSGQRQQSQQHRAQIKHQQTPGNQQSVEDLVASIVGIPGLHHAGAPFQAHIRQFMLNQQTSKGQLAALQAAGPQGNSGSLGSSAHQRSGTADNRGGSGSLGGGNYRKN